MAQEEGSANCKHKMQAVTQPCQILLFFLRLVVEVVRLRGYGCGLFSLF